MVRHGTDAKKGHTMVAEMLTSGWTYVNPGWMNFTRFQHTHKRTKDKRIYVCLLGESIYLCRCLVHWDSDSWLFLDFGPFPTWIKNSLKMLSQVARVFCFCCCLKQTWLWCLTSQKDQCWSKYWGPCFQQRVALTSPSRVRASSFSRHMTYITFSTPRFLPISNFRLQHLILLALRLQKGIEFWNFSWHNFGVLKRHSGTAYFGFPFWNQRCQNMVRKFGSPSGLKRLVHSPKCIGAFAFFSG